MASVQDKEKLAQKKKRIAKLEKIKKEIMAVGEEIPFTAADKAFFSPYIQKILRRNRLTQYEFCEYVFNEYHMTVMQFIEATGIIKPENRGRIREIRKKIADEYYEYFLEHIRECCDPDEVYIDAVWAELKYPRMLKNAAGEMQFDYQDEGLCYKGVMFHPEWKGLKAYTMERYGIPLKEYLLEKGIIKMEPEGYFELEDELFSTAEFLADDRENDDDRIEFSLDSWDENI